MTLRVPLDGGNHATFLSVYAPTLDDECEIKESFYQTLRHTLHTIPKDDKLFVLGDINACVG